MKKKATLSAMEKVKRELEGERPTPIKKAKAKPPIKKKEVKTKAPTQNKPVSEEIPAQEAAIEGQHIPRGQRADFIKTTVTLPIQLLADLRTFGMKRRAKKMKDTDFSALTREAITEFLINHKDD
jgi:hypothetical protein